MENRCVVCGELIPEGRQVCPNCQVEAIKKAAETSRSKMFVGARTTDNGFKRYTKKDNEAN